MEAIPADLQAIDTSGTAVTLVDLAETQPAVLVFLRHFG